MKNFLKKIKNYCLKKKAETFIIFGLIVISVAVVILNLTSILNLSTDKLLYLIIALLCSISWLGIFKDESTLEKISNDIVDIHKSIRISEKAEKMKSVGIINIGYNGTSDSKADQGGVYKESKKIDMLFSAGLGTLRDYEQDIINSILNENCDVRIILSEKDVAKNKMYVTPYGEVDSSKIIIQRIIQKISKTRHKGSIKLKYSSIGPIGSVEIKDDSYCIVVPYLYQRWANNCYHVIYENTGNENDIYHQWKQHFEDIWAEGTIVCEYPNKKNKDNDAYD